MRLTKCLNKRLKYECLCNVGALEQATHDGNDMKVSEVTMSATKMALNYFKELSKDMEKRNKIHAPIVELGTGID